jgi:hypothetical protein
MTQKKQALTRKRTLPEYRIVRKGHRLEQKGAKSRIKATMHIKT